MKFLFHLGHPAHFHLFKNSISELKKRGHQVAILIKTKDVLEELLQNYGLDYHNLLPGGRKDNKTSIALSMIKTDFKLFNFTLKYKPDLLIGTSYAISHVGKILNVPVINVNEDDFDVVPLYSKLSYPWATVILTPFLCRAGKWDNKTVRYSGYHELSYLHPNNFKPDSSVVEKYFPIGSPFFLIRFARLTAHHDVGVRGINSSLAAKLINELEPRGRVFITSERPLEPQFEKYRIKINPLDIHHVMAFAKLFIGDSQTMAVEAGVLGTPFIRFNDFVGRIGILEELELKYKLGYGINPSEEDKLFLTIQELLKTPGLRDEWDTRRQKMLSEKIDVAAFMIWFFENYPESLRKMRADPEYQVSFK